MSDELCNGSKYRDILFFGCSEPDSVALSPIVENNRKISLVINLVDNLTMKPRIKKEILALLQKAREESDFVLDCNNCDIPNEDSDWGWFCDEVSLCYVYESNPYDNKHGCWELYFCECYEVDYYRCVDSFIDESTHLPLLPSYVFDEQSLKALFY